MRRSGDRADDRAQGEAARWHARMLEPRSQSEVEAFESWLAADPANPRAYAEMEALSSAAAILPRPSLERPQERTAPFRWRPAAALAFAAIALLAGLWAWQLGSSPAFAAVSNPGPAVRGIRLSDGTGIVLDAGSEISTAVRAGTREIRVISGRIRVDARSSPKLLQVAAGSISVMAERALFDVGIDGGGVAVAALEGRVAIASDAGRDTSDPTDVGPGRAVSVDAQGRRGIHHDASWPASRMRFDRAPLGDVIALANRLGDPPIALGEPSLASVSVTGVLDLRDTRSLARKLGAALGLQVRDAEVSLTLVR